MYLNSSTNSNSLFDYENDNDPTIIYIDAISSDKPTKHANYQSISSSDQSTDKANYLSPPVRFNTHFPNIKEDEDT